ncbi:unnamed protein product [Pocillopora meandrina]|uniref:Uncharacterized protein n=1 Tax=Pocillopora meandrina TaxID=46732 RepID=A0AAU9XRS3_9CNID|nr:unnamed protein product [Pocillopora meandrina]
MVRGHQFHPNNPIAGQANVVYRDGQNVLENRSLSCAGFSTSLLDASRLETAGQFHQVIPSDAYGMDEEKKNGSVLKIETDPSLNSDGVSASGLPAVTSRSSWVLYSEERTSHTLSASRDDTPVPCRDVPALNVENGESQYQDDALFKPPYTNAIPKPSESILSVTSNQQSTTHPGPITKEAAQSPLSNPMWNRDRKLNMAPLQCSDEEIHSGQEWEESAIIEVEGLASWFDLCGNEDAGKDEHSRWEMSSMEPNKTDGGVERDVFDSEEGLSQGQRLFSEQGNSHIHLSLPDDASVQSRRPEVENEKSQDTSLFTAARNGQTDIVRVLIENGADVNKDTPLSEATTNGHTDIVRLLIENGADVNEEEQAAIYTKKESKVTVLCSIGPTMSDNVPLRIQESCVDYYMVDIFSCVREAKKVGSRLRHQLVMYVTRASEDSGRLNILREVHRGQNTKELYTNSFRWERGKGKILIALFIIGDFEFSKQVERRKIDQMRLAEKVTCILPICDASIVKIEGKLLSENGDMILEMRELDVDLLTMRGGETRCGVEHELVEQDIAIGIQV